MQKISKAASDKVVIMVQELNLTQKIKRGELDPLEYIKITKEQLKYLK